MRTSTSTQLWLALVLAINSSHLPPYNANPIAPNWLQFGAFFSPLQRPCTPPQSPGAIVKAPDGF